MAAHVSSFSSGTPLLSQAVNNHRSIVPVSSQAIIKSHLIRPTKRRSLSTSFSETTTEESRKLASPGGCVSSVPVRVAHELLQAGHHFLDVRTSDEYSAGHVVGAVNVPFMLRLGPGMTRNPKFVEQVLNHFGRYDEIVVGCQLGKRSIVAASELLSIGFTGITDMAGGYDVWMQNGLPSTQ